MENVSSLSHMITIPMTNSKKYIMLKVVGRMAIHCPLSDDVVLYLTCQDCELKIKCRLGILTDEDIEAWNRGDEMCLT